VEGAVGVVFGICVDCGWVGGERVCVGVELHCRGGTRPDTLDGRRQLLGERACDVELCGVVGFSKHGGRFSVHSVAMKARAWGRDTLMELRRRYGRRSATARVVGAMSFSGTRRSHKGELTMRELFSKA